MAVRKLSVAIDEEVAREAAQAAEAEGVSFSAWLTRAAADALVVRRGLEGVRAWEAEHGALSDEQMSEAHRILEAWLGPRE